MPNHRMLAVAALIVLTIPALGAAAPYLPVVVSSAEAEQLVEGHTVFTVIEVNRTTEVNGTTRFAAAVAVLVREYSQENRALRFPGVLWFNDQYLVNPQSQNNNNQLYRYPCGGAVMAVNRGDPDPRVLLANAYVQSDQGTYGSQSQNYTVVNVTADTRGAPGTTPDANLSGDGLYTLPGANVPGTPATSPATFTSTYKETYQITDPNDHTWIIDRYNGYYRTSVSTDPFFGGSQVYEFPIWVVNILGGSVFLPDDGKSTCAPFYDLIDTLYETNTDLRDHGVTPPVTQPESTKFNDGECDNPDGPTYNPNVVPGREYPTVEDDPCEGYKQPSRNGYCYGGQAVPTSGSCTTSATPLRLYNALLYFKLEDLRYAGALRDHNATSTDTNGCAAGTEWSCPAEGDNAEGNSHPFHPTPHSAHTDKGPCYATGGGYQPNPNPTNHGGSRNAAYGTDTNGAYSGAGGEGCDYVHATRDIDIYFSPEGRPLAPLSRSVAGGVHSDTDGSDAPFHDYNRAYGTSEP